MKGILFTVSLLAALNPLFAQKIKVNETTERIGGGDHSALTVSVYQATGEQIEKGLKSMMKDYDAKVSAQDGGLFGDNAMIKKMSKNTIDIYAKWDKVNENETKVTVAFDLGGVFLSSDQLEQLKEAKEIVRDFASKTTLDAFAALLKTEEKTFDVLNSEEKSLEKEIKNLNDDIADYNQKIADNNQRIKKAQEQIAEDNKNLSAKKDELDKQQKELMATKDKQKKVD